MRHFIRSSHLSFVLGGFVVAGLAGCTGVATPGSITGSGGNSGTPTGSGGNSGTPTGSGGNNGTPTGSGGNNGTPTGSGGSIGGGATITCAPGIPATTQLRRMQNWQYQAAVKDLLGITTVDVGSGAKLPSDLLYADFDGPLVPDAWRIYNDVAAGIAKAVMANATLKANFISCDPATSGCLNTTIKTFGRKAFRRPLTDAEVTRFMNIGAGTPTGTPAEVAEATLLAFLVSPSFLWIPEISTATTAGSGFQLSPHEVAAKLSFMLWGSVPDATLSTAADNNQLGTKDQIMAQANRLIMDRTRTAPIVTLFHRNWVQMDNANQHWWNTDHDMTKFPLYTNPSVKTSYATEMDKFFEEVVFTNGGYKDLFLSTVGFINKDNAAIYGMSNTGTALTKVSLDPAQRPGFMTRAGFLASYSHYDMTAPILRGAFITILMIGVDPGAPLPGATMLQPPAGTYATVRDRTDALVNQAANCMGCHTNVINPPGYVLENYDAIGAWQTVDKLGNGAINPVAMVNFGNGNVKQISNAQQLMQELATIPKGQAMYAQNWVSFAYGRAPNPADQCVADGIATKLAGSSYPITSVLADLTQADSFRSRVQAP